MVNRVGDLETLSVFRRLLEAIVALETLVLVYVKTAVGNQGGNRLTKESRQIEIKFGLAEIADSEGFADQTMIEVRFVAGAVDQSETGVGVADFTSPRAQVAPKTTDGAGIRAIGQSPVLLIL